MNELRAAVTALNECREDFLDKYPAADLLNIWRAWRACGWDIYPDQWTDRQLREATTLRIIPRWIASDEGNATKPDYSPATQRRFTA